MASLHHCHCRHHHHPPPTTIATCYCCCTPSPHPPPTDPLLHSIAYQSHPLHHSPPQPHQYSPYPNQFHNPHNHHYTQSQYNPPQTHQQEQTQQQPIVSSLLRRIAALESSLRRQYSANSTSFSLRDAAARTIQTHFRAFLVRRSRTLRQLKELTFVKSTLNTLKNALSENTHIDSQALSHKAMGLLLKLDSIQGGDPMIRDGKRSISRELIRFLGLIDGVSVKRSELSSRAVKNVRFGGNGNKTRVLHNERRMGTAEYGDLGGDERKLIEELRDQVEKIRGFSRVSEDEDEDEEDVGPDNPIISINGKSGFSQNRHGGLLKKHGGVQSKMKKSVSFAENGNVPRVFRSTHEQILGGDTNSSDGSGSIDEERELLDNLCRKVEEIGVFTKDAEDEEEHTEDGDSPQISDGERDVRRNLSAEGNCEISGHFEGQNGKFVFSAPLPVKMESKADLMKKRKAVKIVN